MPHILVIDDDTTFATVLARSLQKRGYTSHIAHEQESAIRVLKQYPVNRIVLDMKLEHTSGLKILPLLLEERPKVQIVILTGYSSISTAVEAIKLGAINYLCKPCDADEVVAAFQGGSGNPDVELPSTPPSVNRIQWEHIQKVLEDHQGNISATARALGMHRRTLQRKLQKKPQSR